MRLGVNARRLAGQRLGVARYIEYLLRHWATMLLPGDQLTLYARDALRPDGLGLPPAAATRILHPRLTGLLWENALLPLRARELDVLFCPSYSVPLGYPGRCVVAIHSVNEVQRQAHPAWYSVTYGRLYQLSARSAARVLVPSESVREDLLRFYRVPVGKVEIVPLGVDDAFRPIADADQQRATRIRLLGEDRPYILFVGKLSVRRNIPALLAAYAAARTRERIPHALVLVGPNHLGLPLREMAGTLGIADGLIQLDGDFADHTELVAIYNAADLFVHPSSYEGFCLPLLEALACGVPAVTVNRSALREIADGCAVLVDEPTPEALADAILQTLRDGPQRQRLRAGGPRRARAFRWDVTASRTLAALRMVAEQ